MRVAIKLLKAVVALFLAIPVISGGASPAAAEDCRPKRLAAFPVTLLGNLPIARLAVDGGVATFLIDTGAERTILTKVAAARLGVEARYEYSRRMRSLGGAVASGDARLRQFGVSGAMLPNFKVLVASLSLPGPSGQPLDGLLGADFLTSFAIDIDLPHTSATLYEGLTCAIAAPPWNQAYSRISANRSLHDRLFFPVILDGHRLAALIDTGAQLTTVDAEAAARLGVTGAELARDPVANLRGVASEVVKSHAHRFARLEIGGDMIRDPIIVVTRLGLQDADLILGADFLRSRRVWLSYGSHQIFVAH